MKIFHYSILFISIFSFYAIFIPYGQMPSDTLYSIATAHSLYHGSLHIEKSEMFPYAVRGKSGYFYSKYGIGYAALFIPSVAIASHIRTIIGVPEQQIVRAGASLTNTIFATVAIILFICLFNKMRLSTKETLFTAFLISAGSLLLPYSKINHTEIPTTVVLLIFLLIWYDCSKLTIRKGLSIGICIGLLLLLKAGNIIYALTLFSCGLYCVLFNRASKYAGMALISFPFLTIFLLLWLNWHRFGTIFNTGYGNEQVRFTTSLIYGLYGLLFSPSKSIFIFSPMLLLSIPGSLTAIRKHTRFSIPILALFVLNLLFYSLWHDWHGGWAWGPRFMVPPLILMFIFIPFGFQTFGKIENRNQHSRPAVKTVLYKYPWLIKGGLMCIVLLSIAINMLGALVWYQQVYYFHCNYTSIKQAHPLIAAKLFLHKAENLQEMYTCSDFGRNGSNPPYNTEWNNLVHGDYIDFSTFETFRGFSTIWGKMRFETHSDIFLLIPLLLLLISVGGFLLWFKGSKNFWQVR